MLKENELSFHDVTPGNPLQFSEKSDRQGKSLQWIWIFFIENISAQTSPSYFQFEQIL